MAQQKINQKQLTSLNTFTCVHKKLLFSFFCTFTRYLCPKRSVDLVSASLKADGEQQMMMVVLQFPPRES